MCLKPVSLGLPGKVSVVYVLLVLLGVPWALLWLEGAVFAAVVLGFKVINENQLRAGLGGAGGAVAPVSAPAAGTPAARAAGTDAFCAKQRGLDEILGRNCSL